MNPDETYANEAFDQYVNPNEFFSSDEEEFEINGDCPLEPTQVEIIKTKELESLREDRRFLARKLRDERVDQERNLAEIDNLRFDLFCAESSIQNLAARLVKAEQKIIELRQHIDGQQHTIHRLRDENVQLLNDYFNLKFT